MKWKRRSLISDCRNWKACRGMWSSAVLGCSYTAVAALEHREVASLLIVDALLPVIEWHQKGRVPLGEKLTSDPRCAMLHADFCSCSRSEYGFDPNEPGRLFHAVLLDIHHSPRSLLHPSNAIFYQAEGLHALSAYLHPGGGLRPLV